MTDLSWQLLTVITTKFKHSAHSSICLPDYKWNSAEENSNNSGFCCKLLGKFKHVPVATEQIFGSPIQSIFHPPESQDL